MLKFYIDEKGSYLGATDNTELSEFTVDTPPLNSTQHWDGTKWIGSTRSIFERYGDFRIMAMRTQAWLKMRNKCPQADLIEFIGAVAYFDQNLALIKLLWNRNVLTLQTLGFALDTIEVTELSTLVTTLELTKDQCTMSQSITFNDLGLML